MMISEKKIGSANDYLEVFDEKINDSEGPVSVSIAENMADMYQDLKNFIILYQTGTVEVMNDALWECRMNFENYWGQKLVNALNVNLIVLHVIKINLIVLNVMD